jgi:hypothetical protein
MKQLFILCLVCSFISMAGNAQQTKTKVLLLGSFHFDNPGLDVAKFENANILSAKRQAEVMEVVEKIKQFRPDKIFIEMPVERQQRLDSSFNRYKAGELKLGASETHQIAYRVAKELNHTGLYAVDYTEADFAFDSLMKSATAAKQFEFLGMIQQTIGAVEKEFNESLKTKTVKEILLHHNSPEYIRMAVGMYYEFLIAGEKGNHVGSYVTSEWWRRNMVIYENVLKSLNGKEERILILFGSGHTALLNEMMKYNQKLELVPLADVLK